MNSFGGGKKLKTIFGGDENVQIQVNIYVVQHGFMERMSTSVSFLITGSCLSAFSQ